MSREVKTKEEDVSKEVKSPPESMDDVLYLAQRDLLTDEDREDIDEEKLAAALRGEEVDNLDKEDEDDEEDDENPNGGTEDEYSSMTVDELRAELSERGLPVHGLKAELQDRLRADDTQ